MTPEPGDSPNDDDNWVRVITLPSHINTDGTLHHQAFKVTPVRPELRRRWDRELSGRLLSLTENLDAEAIGFVRRVRQDARERGRPLPSVFGYYGHMGATRSAIHGIEPLRMDVIYTPKDLTAAVPDRAHADVVFLTKNDDEVHELCSKLQGIVRLFPPDRTTDLEDLRMVAG